MIDLLNEEQLMKELEADSKINSLALSDEIVRSSELLFKWLKYHQFYKRTLSKAESRLNDMILRKTRYYDGHGTPQEYREKPFNEVIRNQTVLGQYVEADPEICTYRENIEAFEGLKEICSEMVNTLKFRNNHLNTIFEIRKFESGE